MTTETDSSSIPRSASIAASAQRVRLRDGAVVDVHPIRPADGERLRHFHARLSPLSIQMRYFHAVPSLPEAVVAAFLCIDAVNRMTLVATVDDDAQVTSRWEIVGMVNCDRISPNAAEIAFLVEDAWQGRGVASILLYDAATWAHECGFRRFLAITLRRNHRMLNMLRHCGFPCTLHDVVGDEEVEVWLDITAPPLCPLARSRQETIWAMDVDFMSKPESTYPITRGLAVCAIHDADA
ncbi:MAG TPA: GNAT family N-acetyltransferase [Ktedonobacterales bacterium]|nr:GNAT family N-acetyltransferase [Ktedonobacterales bacterium]